MHLGLYIAVLPLAFVGCAHPPAAPKLSIAAAADLRFALDELSHGFRTSYPQWDVQIAYGSSGNFYWQIRNQAPFDLFLSADVEYPRKLAEEGFAAPESLFLYAAGRIVVWIRAQSPLDLAQLQIHALEASAVKHVAIANPRHAPYGRAAEAAMRSLGVYERVAPKLVLGENVAQAMEFIQSGAADAGIIALSLALAPPVRGQGRFWEVPLDAYPRMEQGGAILSRSKAKIAAGAFRAFLLGAGGRSVLRKYGFYLSDR